ncbi:GNAT family N-acetyltransferase [Psychrosphaera ytuae]|uniref:GNAT family N-acetyltransferase n=1 Tax=Psychrosphaera ytuae TaxID=2820710 RepID=A0A975D9M7_9GAMM|nr:GNAT family N-acetyltransferase [Psychrosphaera ytuae]QTH62898.1 GNAT family N-acetyltransferase [Psychrosphaera ytuae]
MSSESIAWQIQPFSSLTARQLHDMLKVRSDVFVVEQNCVYSDIDGLDVLPGVFHVFGYAGEQLVGTCRILAPGLVYEQCSAIGRVVIDEAFRGQKKAYEMMKFALQQTNDLWPNSICKISAQEHLQNFYQSLGFSTCSDMYLEDGIPHVSMTRPAGLVVQK